MREIAKYVGRSWNIAVVVVLCSPAIGTSALIIRTPQQMVIAADGMAHHGGDSVPVCKIKRVNGIYFVIAGLTNDTVTGFDATKIAEDAAKRSSSADDAATAFAVAAAKGFSGAMEHTRRADRAYYYSPSGPKQAPQPLQVIFTSVSGMNPTFTIIYFTVDDAKKIDVAPHFIRCPGDGCIGGTGMQSIGENHEIRKIGFTPLNGETTAAFAERLIRREAIAFPLKVGAPIDVLSIAPMGGSTWIKNERGCP